MTSNSVMDQLNETPVTYGILLVYVTLAYLTGSLTLDSDVRKLVTFGASCGFLVQDGQLWRVLASGFLHGNLLHLALNAFAILQLGPPLERHFGTWRFMLLYATGTAGGALLALFANNPFTPLVGGSTALFGMLGALVALQIRGGRTMLDFLDNQTARTLIATILFYLLAGFFIPVVSNSGHFGGLVAGFVLTFCFLDRGRRNETDGTSRFVQAAWILLLGSMVLYQLNPVLREDFRIRQYLSETDPLRKSQLRALLDQRYRPYMGIEKDRAAEREPRSGVVAVIQLEQEFREYGWPEFSAALRRWKNGG